MIRDITVLVPAADEEEHISGCLDSIGTALDYLNGKLGGTQARIVVVLDDCRDGTAKIVTRHQAVEAVISTDRNVGTARRLGAEYALKSVTTHQTAWLANADADSRVPQHWLTGMVQQANRGADVIVGTVVPGNGLRPQTEHAWFAAHDLSDGHRHVHGANFGIRASTYLSLGGWRSLISGEDTDLADRAAGAAGVYVVRSAMTPVVTSTRGQGRAPHGFSSYLRKLREANSSTNPPIGGRLARPANL